MRAIQSAATRLMAVSVAAASLVGIATPPAVADIHRSCPLDTGIVINESNKVWGSDSVRADLDINAATLGPGAVSIPAGQTRAGLPVGLQVTTRRHTDELALRLARIAEQINPWPLTAPGWY